MSSNEPSLDPSSQLLEGINIMKACQPLVVRLRHQGVTISLDQKEKTNLLNFKKLVDANLSDSDWSYLRVASGTQVSGVAVLRSCLIRLQSSEAQQS